LSYGLGKPRTKFGKFLDRCGIDQLAFAEKSGLGRNTVSRLCNNEEHGVYESTQIKAISTLRRMGYDVRMEDFW
jgi:transcriptional regulator with XRE-family HTH domain